MFKVVRRITRTVKDGEVMESVYDRGLNEVRSTMYRLIMALCSVAKITPKQLAKAYGSDKAKKFSKDFNTILNKQAEQVEKDLEKAVNKKSKSKDAPSN